MLHTRPAATLVVQCTCVCQSNALLWWLLRSVSMMQRDRQSRPASFGRASRTLSRCLRTSTAVFRAPFGLELSRNDVRNAYIILGYRTSQETPDRPSYKRRRERYLFFGLRRRLRESIVILDRCSVTSTGVPESTTHVRNKSPTRSRPTTLQRGTPTDDWICKKDGIPRAAR